MALEGLGPVRLGDFELLALVVEAQEAGRRHGIDGSLGHADGARLALLHQLLAGHEFGVAAEQNVGAAAGHVGGDGDHAEAAGLGDDFCFALVELGVQHHVAHALALQNSGEPLRLLNRRGADQHRLLLLVQRGNIVGDGFVFFLLGAVDNVGIFKPPHRLVGGNDDDFELVDLLEFGGFGFGGAGHAAQLLVEAEVVLEGDGGQRLVFLADADAFFGFDGLVQAIGPAAARHQAAGEGVDDDDFAVLDHVVHVALVERVGLDGGFDVVLQVPVFGVGDVVDAQQLSRS